MFGLGVGEILVILVIALIFIGPKKLPELAKTLGRGFSEFQNAMKGINNTIQNPGQHLNNHPQTPAQPGQQHHDDHVYEDDPPHDQNLPDDEKEFLATEAEKLAQDDKKQTEN